ncbi:MAG: nuclease-related domain-containing protein [Acidimicrobiia bacterium]
MQSQAASGDDRRRGARTVAATPAGDGAGRHVLLIGAAVLVIFVAVDLLAILRPDIGSVLARNIAVLTAVGVATVTAIVALYLTGRSRQKTSTSGSDTLAMVLDEIGGYTAIHGVNTRHGRIDHVLVGQGGVYVIAGDSARGRGAVEERGVRVGGRQVPAERYVRLGQQARHLESRVHQVCGRRLPVHALYVFTRAGLGRDASHHGVRFTSLAALPALLMHSRYFVDPRDVAIVKALVTGDPTALAQEARFGPDSRSPLFPEAAPRQARTTNGGQLRG